MVNIENALLMGASGKVGGLLRKAWSLHNPEHLSLISQFRKSGKYGSRSLIWNPDQTSTTFPVNENLDICNDRTAMIVFSGVTPRTEANLSDNTQIAINCLNAAKELGIRRVLIASSSAVYGEGQGEPIRENHPLNASSRYGVAKIRMEEAVYEHAKDIEICCLRIGNVLGADALMLNAKKVDRSMHLEIDRFPSGKGPVRSYIDPVKLVSVISTLATYKEKLPQVLNVACPTETSMSEIANIAKIEWKWRPAIKGAYERIILDCSALSRIHEFEKDECQLPKMYERYLQVEAVT